MTETHITIEDAQSMTPEKTLKIVQILGQLDESNVDEQIQTIYKLIEEYPKNLDIILDLENLEYLNSKSIGYLTDIYGKITENGGKTVITKARPNITDILQVVGLTQLIPLSDSLEEAKSKLNPQQAEINTPPATEEATTTDSATPAEQTTQPEQMQQEQAPAPQQTPATEQAEPLTPEQAQTAQQTATQIQTPITETPSPETPSPEMPPASTENQPTETEASEEATRQEPPAQQAEPSAQQAEPSAQPTGPQVQPTETATPQAPEQPAEIPQTPLNQENQDSQTPNTPSVIQEKNPTESGNYKFEN